MAKSSITRNAKKITIEFDNSETIELDIEKNNSFILSAQAGRRKVPGRFNEIEIVPNGIKIFSILIGPDFIINDLNKDLESQINLAVNQSF